MSFFKEFLSKFPSSFITRKLNNNWKLTKFFTSGLDDTKNVLTTIEKYRNINNAEGKALDNLGIKYGVQRGPADDAFYRMMIRAKIANRKGDTTINGILTTMKNALNIDVKGIKIDFVYYDDKPEPLSLRISNIPLTFARSEFEQQFMLEQIESIIAVGVRLQDLQYEISATSNLCIGGAATVYVYKIYSDKSLPSNSDGEATIEIIKDINSRYAH